MMIKNTLLRVSVGLSLGASAALGTALPAAARPVRPDPEPTLPGGLQDKMDTLLGVLMALVIFACVAGVLIVAALLAIAMRRGSLEDHLGRLGGVAAACVLVGGASTFVMFLI